MKKDERRTVQAVEPWIVNRVSEALKATGRLNEFSIEDIAQDELRQIIRNIQHAKRMREAGGASLASSLIWDEVMR